jgi:hypothetical protein
MVESRFCVLPSQVERLSGLVEMGPERIEKVEDQLRLQVINSTINIDKRLVNLYQLIENDLLGSLQFSVSYIAPYGVSCGHFHSLDPLDPLDPKIR